MAAFAVLHSPSAPRSLSILSHASPRRHGSDSATNMSQNETQFMFDETNDALSVNKENIHPNIISKVDDGGNDSSESNSKSTFQLSPSKTQMSFTPRRTKPPPRAWERRPATPFVQRSEGQKIWKRMPLGELGIEGSEQDSRRETEELQNYTRIVKKLRLGSGTAHQDSQEENEAMAAAEKGSCGTKWERENIEKGGSPKKKIRRDRHDGDPRRDQINIDDTLTAEDSVTADTERTEPTHSRKGDASIEEGPAETITLVSKASTAHDADEPELTFMTVVQPCLGESEVLDVQTDLVPEDAECDEAGDEQSSPTGRFDIEPHESKVAAPETETAQTWPRESSETYTASVNEEEGLEAPEHNDPLAFAVSESADGHLGVSSVAPSPARTQSLHVDDEHDEAAFLRGFLERAQASRAAKIGISPQKTPAPPSPFVDELQSTCRTDHTKDAEAIEDVEDDDLSPPAEPSQSKPMPEEDAISSSPLRRSTRTSTRASGTRLPRFQPQNLPLVPHFGPVLPSQHATIQLSNTIQLKRATGCEFIFNAREQQNLAIMTRSNTKKNQGTAVYVAQRLLQLQKEFEVLHDNGQPSVDRISLHNSEAAAENDSTQLSDASQGQKKRKRERQMDEKATKIRKTVKWPIEDQLVRFREASPAVDDAERDECMQVAPCAIDVRQPPIGQESNILEDQSNTDEANSDQKKKDNIEDTSKLKVRRIRKIKLDSVNGTPAPKTRSRSIVDMEPVESSTGAVSTGQPSGIASSTRRSSRMPVPVSRSISQPSFAAASTRSKAKIADESKTKSQAKSANKDQIDEVTTSLTAKFDTVEPTEPDRKLDGRRRLRAKRG